MKTLGKIVRAEFGMSDGCDDWVGLHLEFKFSNACHITSEDSLIYDLNNETVSAATAKTLFLRIKRILQDAQVNSVSGLVGKPVEIGIDDSTNTFEWFRILTEVI